MIVDVVLRRLEPEDIPAAVDFAIEGMQAHKYPLRVSPQKVRAVADHAMRSPDGFHLGAWKGGRIVGGLVALSYEMMFFDWSEACIVMLRATEPGVGARLIRACMRWVAGEMRIRRVIAPLEYGHDPRIAALLGRMGFQAPQTMMVHYKGGL